MRELTGKWFIKKTLFGFKVKVEIRYASRSFYPLDITHTKYVNAEKSDLIELGIHIL